MALHKGHSRALKGPTGRQTKLIKSLRLAVGAPKGSMPATAVAAAREIARLQRQRESGQRWSESDPPKADAVVGRQRELQRKIDASVQQRLT